VGADGFVSIVPSGAYQDESRSILEEKCDKILKKCGLLLQQQQVRFKMEKLIGSPVELILEKAQVADLVVVGKRGEFERWDNTELGVTVQSVCRSIAKPLLIVKKELRPIKKILLGYDGSIHANKALQVAAALAEGLQAQLTVLCVADEEEMGKHTCQEAQEYLGGYNVEATTSILPGQPDRVLVTFAEQNGMDVIAIGGFGHSRIREAILGSTTEHILRISTCPVLLVK
jgi:nucleotide-binding universal stress UspA family protein